MMKKMTLYLAVLFLLTFSISNSVLQAQEFVEIQKLLADDGNSYDKFGSAICISGDYVIVGAENDNEIGPYSGSAYIYHFNGEFWEQQDKLLPSIGDDHAWFGNAVSMYGDYAIVGASGTSLYMFDQIGVVYIYNNNNGVWEQMTKLYATYDDNDRFGTRVGISGDYAICTARGDDDNGDNSGAAYVYFNDNDTWQQLQKLTTSDGEAGDNFGVSLSMNDNYAIIGAYLDDDNGNNSGAAYVFVNNSGVWEEQTKIITSDGSIDDEFGQSVSIYNDIAVVGCYKDDDNGSNSGAVYIFKNENGIWEEKQKLIASDGNEDDWFGISTCISENTIIVGAQQDDNNGSNSGSAYLFMYNNNDNLWEECSKFTPSDNYSEDYFGHSMSISNSSVIIGSNGDDDNGDWSGSAYVFDLPHQPQINNHPENIYNLCSNNYGSFSITSENQLYYQWQKSLDNGISYMDIEDGGPYSGASTNELLVMVDESMNNNQFRCYVWNGIGSDTSNAAILTVNPQPFSLFAATTECQGAPTQFTDISTISYGSNIEWYWGFDDGTTSNEQNPVHTYDLPGTYLVTLHITSDQGCEDVYGEEVIVYPKPLASFSFLSECLGTPIPFSDSSTITSGSITTWQWDFGDGQISAEQNPSHLYNSAGDYSVQLTVESDYGCSDVYSEMVTVSISPNADFEYEVACQDLPTSFSDLSAIATGQIVSWNWDFGDGNTSIEQNPVHTYQDVGLYNVQLTVESEGGCSDMIQYQVDIPGQPVAYFEDGTICSAYPFQFTDLSTVENDVIVSWLWDFGDGTNSTEQNPSHTFGNDVEYFVTLTVTTSSGCIDAITRSMYIPPSPYAEFSYSNACAGTDVSFFDQSTIENDGIVYWEWSFPGGWFEWEQNTSFYFEEPGTYTVCLYVESSEFCTDYICHDIVIYPSPQAAFEATTVCEGNTTSFNDLSTIDEGSIVGWEWNFGDGETTQEQNPNHLYTAAGVYTVQLTVESNEDCTHQVNQSVIVNPIPITSFEATEECLGNATFFTDQSTIDFGNITSWTWDFGDGNTSTDQNPYHTYSEPGLFNVQLITDSDAGCVNEIVHQVQVHDIPIADFEFNNVCQLQQASFTDLSVIGIGNINSWFWDFGDGNTSNDQNPQHLYSEVGIFDVELVVETDGNCTDMLTQSIEIFEKPLADFNYVESCPGNPTLFTDNSTISAGQIDSWLWDFGDGNTSLEQHPEHIYDSQGPFNVSLVVESDQMCANEIMQEVILLEPPFADFLSESQCLGTPYQFSDMSWTNTGTIVEWEWDFGDGNTSAQQSPIHTYNAIGSYSVSLIVITDIGCTDTQVQTMNVYPVPEAEFSFSLECVGSPTQFTDESFIEEGSILDWYWDFGDGNTAYEQNPTHTFSSVGEYEVSLEVWSWDGSMDPCIDEISYTVTLYPYPVADFEFSTPCSIEPMQFTDLSTIDMGEITSWLWDFGDGNSSNEQNPSYTYLTSGSYNVSLSVWTTQECEDSFSQNIEVGEIPSQAGSISGSQDVCSGNSEDYQTSGSVNADTYLWYLEPADAGEITGNTTNVSIVWSSNYSGDANISVRGLNICGEGELSPVFNVNIHPLPSITFNPIPDQCLNYPPYELSEGSPFGGEYSGSGVVDGYFYPDIAGLGLHNIEYFYSDEYGCENIEEQDVLVDECTEINNIQESIELMISPNPSLDIFNVTINKQLKNVKFQIMDGIGSSLKETVLPSIKSDQIISFDLSDFPTGIYYLVISHKDFKKTEKLVLQ